MYHWQHNNILLKEIQKQKKTSRHGWESNIKISQAVSRWLPTAAVRGSRLGRHVGFCGGQSGAGAGFLRVLRFPLPNSFHQLLQKKIIIINQSSGTCTIGQMGKRLWPQYKGLIDT
jgi:hypothetical protein